MAAILIAPVEEITPERLIDRPFFRVVKLWCENDRWMAYILLGPPHRGTGIPWMRIRELNGMVENCKIM